MKSSTAQARAMTPQERIAARNRLVKSIPADQKLLAAIKREDKRLKGKHEQPSIHE